WEDIDKKAQTASAPSLIYGEPDVVIRVIRDIFNEDFAEVVVQGADEWETVDNYLRWVAPDLAARGRRATREGARPQGLVALGRVSRHRPDRGDDRRRRQHREVHRQGRQPRRDGHQEQHRSGRGDRAAATAPRPRR